VPFGIWSQTVYSLGPLFLSAIGYFDGETRELTPSCSNLSTHHGNSSWLGLAQRVSLQSMSYGAVVQTRMISLIQTYD